MVRQFRSSERIPISSAIIDDDNNGKVEYVSYLPFDFPVALSIKSNGIEANVPAITEISALKVIPNIPFINPDFGGRMAGIKVLSPL